MIHSRGEVGARWLGRNLSALSFGSRCTTPATYKPLLSRGSFLEQGGVGANSNGGEAVIRIKFCYYPYYIPSSETSSFRFIALTRTDRPSGPSRRTTYRPSQKSVAIPRAPLSY